MENTGENCEKIWKLWKKGKDSEKIWKVCNKLQRLKCNVTCFPSI